MKLLNAWYAVSHSLYLKEGEPYFFSLFGESLVLFRDKEKNPVCIKNRCPHRSSPFEGGVVSDGEIVCPYHGARYGTFGKCSNVEQVICQHIVDADYQDYAKSIVAWIYPCYENEGYIWVYYTGRASQKPTEAPITEIPLDLCYGNPNLTFDSTVSDMETNWSFVIENHLDILHLFYVHSGELGPQISRKRLRKFIVEFSRDSKNRNILQSTFRNKDNEEFISIRFIPPARVIISKLEKKSFYGRTQILDHIPLTRGQTRILVRHYIQKNHPQNYIPLSHDIWQWKSWKIFTQDHPIMKGQAHQTFLYGRYHKQYLLEEDKIASAYLAALQKEESACDPWTAYLHQPNHGEPVAPNEILLNRIPLQFPPANMKLYRKLQLKFRVLGLCLLFLLVIGIYLLL